MIQFMVVVAAVWILQVLLGFWQIRHFNERFRLLRKEGRVVIGKAKGRLMVGVVVMFCIDSNCKIIKGEKMEGISIFARLQPFNVFNNLNLLLIDEQTCKNLGNQTTKAVINAIENYRAFIISMKEEEVKQLEREKVMV